MGTGDVHNNPSGGWGGGVLPWMDFTSVCYSTGYGFWLWKWHKKHPLHLEKEYMLFQFDSGKGWFFPHSPSTLGANQGGGVLPCKARYIGMSSCHFITEPATGTSFPFFAIILFSGTELQINPSFLEQVQRAIDSAAHPHSRFKGIPHSEMIIMIDKTWQLIAGKHKPGFRTINSLLKSLLPRQISPCRNHGQ